MNSSLIVNVDLISSEIFRILNIFYCCTDPDQGQRDGVCERHHVLQGEERHPRRGQRGRLQRLCPAAGRHHAEERAGDHDSWGHSLQQRGHCQGDEGHLVEARKVY